MSPEEDPQPPPLHQSPKGAVTPERLGILDGASGEAIDMGGHLLTQGRDGLPSTEEQLALPKHTSS